MGPGDADTGMRPAGMGRRAHWRRPRVNYWSRRGLRTGRQTGRDPGDGIAVDIEGLDIGDGQAGQRCQQLGGQDPVAAHGLGQQKVGREIALFDSDNADGGRRERLSQAVDQIRERFGEGKNYQKPGRSAGTTSFLFGRDFSVTERMIK